MPTTLPIEMGVKLQIQIKMPPERFDSFLVGMEEGKYLIATLPNQRIAEIKAALPPGKPVIVRYIYKGSVMGFASAAQGVIINPAKLLFISYPQKIDDMNLRKFQRSECYLPARFRLRNGEIEGFITDISENGCQFSFKPPLSYLPPDKGTETTFVFNLPGVSGELAVEGIIRNVREMGKKQAFGVQFTGMEDEVTTELGRYLEKMREHIAEEET